MVSEMERDVWHFRASRHDNASLCGTAYIYPRKFTDRPEHVTCGECRCAMKTPMTEPLVEELRGLLAKATKGPWKAERHSVIDLSIAMSWLRRSPDVTLGSGNDGDAHLIVAAVNALPALLDRINAQAATIEALAKGLRAIVAGDVQRPVKDHWRTDKAPSKHDMCPHGVEMYADCSNCTAAHIEALLSSIPEAAAGGGA